VGREASCVKDETRILLGAKGAGRSPEGANGCRKPAGTALEGDEGPKAKSENDGRGAKPYMMTKGDKPRLDTGRATRKKHRLKGVKRTTPRRIFSLVETFQGRDSSPSDSSQADTCPRMRLPAELGRCRLATVDQHDFRLGHEVITVALASGRR